MLEVFQGAAFDEVEHDDAVVLDVGKAGRAAAAHRTRIADSSMASRKAG